MSKTINDFGDQWTTYRDNEGYYGSSELFSDIVGPYAPSFSGKRVADIGAGTGRISLMLVNEGAKEVLAIEPSRAFDVLKENTRDKPIVCINSSGEAVQKFKPFDAVVSIGVLHHIPEPDTVVRAGYDSLKKGGHIVVWLYGYEGNELYLSVISKLRAVTSRIPDVFLKLLCHIFNFFLAIYIQTCKFIPMPMHRYMTEVIGKFDLKKRYLVIFDQLNPQHAKYYKKEEAIALIEKGGFKNIKTYHRHNYSWTVVGEK